MPRGRPPYLPAQEDTTGSYLDAACNPGGRFAVDHINGNSLEPEVRDAWNAILHQVFRWDQGYMISHETQIRSRRADIKVSSVTTGTRRNFFILELKGSAYSTSEESLKNAEDQLSQYLQSIGQTDLNQLWGALCIGKNVQFYKVGVRKNRLKLHCLHDGMLRIDRQPQTVSGYLEDIKSAVS